MTRATKRPLPAVLLAASAAWAGCLISGCRHHEDDAPAVVSPTLQQQTRFEGDHLYQEGRLLRERGLTLREQGKDGDDLIKQGEEKMAEGQRLREKALMMRTQ